VWPACLSNQPPHNRLLITELAQRFFERNAWAMCIDSPSKTCKLVLSTLSSKDEDKLCELQDSVFLCCCPTIYHS